MGVRILIDDENNAAALYCSTSDWAFGPVVNGTDEKDAFERLQAFIRWSGRTDLRSLSEDELSLKYSQWLKQESDQYAKERLESLLRDEQDGALLDDEVPELAALRARFPGIE